MDAAAADELRRLRARAYGPDADIADDPVALARLHELESPIAPVAASPARPTTASTATPITADGHEQEDTADRSASAPEGADDEVATGDVQMAPARRRLRSRGMAIVLAAVAVIALIGITATVTSIQARQNAYDAPVEAVLAVVPGAEMPAMFGPRDGESEVFADFYGLTPVSASVLMGGSADSECLMVMESAALAQATDNSYGGMSFYGCGAGPFPATISLLVSAQMPEAMRERYPIGTALQFVLEDVGVVVLGAAPVDDA